MKLYASIDSDKGGRECGKGGDKALQVNIRNGNALLCKLYVSHNPRTGETLAVMYTELFGRQYEKGRVTMFENIEKATTKRATR